MAKRGARRIHHSGRVIELHRQPEPVREEPLRSYKDFAPVTLAAASPNVAGGATSIPAKTVKELVELLQENPGKYTIANPGIGTTPQLAAELFKLTFKLDAASVPFSGAGPAISRRSPAIRQSRSARCRRPRRRCRPEVARAGGDLGRSARPRCPTCRRSSEAGLSDQESETMQGIFAPAGTPPAIVKQLHNET